MKEKIVEALAELGFTTYEFDPGYFVFTFEGVNLMYVVTEDVPNFLFLAVPCAMPSETYTEEEMNVVMNEANKDLHYTKMYLADEENAWITFERSIIESDEAHLEEILSHMIQNLALSKRYVDRKCKELFPKEPLEEDEEMIEE